jgi:pyridoxal phosphate enzyme (YggS family)
MGQPAGEGRSSDEESGARNERHDGGDSRVPQPKPGRPRDSAYHADDADDVSLAERRARVAAGITKVRSRIAAACASAGRAVDEVTLVGVAKTYPADDVRLLVELGIHDIGENRDQEARGKVAACGDLDIRWHFIGQLQTNKASSVARYAAMVHSVDRPALVSALGAAAGRVERVLDCLVQVNLDADPVVSRRGGAAPADVPALADQLAATPGLRLAGVMAVAPAHTRGSESAAFAAFERLAEIAARVRAAHPDARVISAGMSADLVPAIRAGSTHVRVGTALLGARPPGI